MQRTERQRLVLGNWKMHGNLQKNQQLIKELLDALRALGEKLVSDRVVAGVVVPFPYLASVQQQLQDSTLAWGAQDISRFAEGAYTGEVAGSMLSDFACRYVLVGHSERRQYHGETNAIVAEKAVAALTASLTPVVCFGETKEERVAGTYQAVILQQLDAVIAVAKSALTKMVFAYEPVWAIGTGLTASPEQAQEIHALVRQHLAQAGAPNVSILYGGSVKPENAEALFSMQDIDGGLIGGASLDAKAFAAIIQTAVHARSH